MAKRRVRIDVSSEHSSRLRQEVFCNQEMSVADRRRALKKLVPVPGDGSPIDVYCDGDFLGAV